MNGHRMVINITLGLILCASLCGLARAQSSEPLVILESSLPPMDAGVDQRIQLHATGGVPPYRWAVIGDLPEGMIFTADGVLMGRPTKPGAFAMTVSVFDSGRPAHAINKEFRSLVTAALVLEWLRPPAVHGTQIDGAVQVSNSTQDKFDLTVFIVAVNQIGRATALGYQRLDLRPGSTNVQIPFTETLPPGTYVVHADAIAEIPAKGVILRQRLQTPGALHVTQGP